jgi:hypothetical protein
MHTAPPAPHDAVDSFENVSHAPALQQPEQATPPQLHAPLEQASPVAHMPQAVPPVPHSDPDWADTATQTPAGLQQPPGHEDASHTHCPVALHSCPELHAAHALPPVPHELVACDPYVSQNPVAPPLQQPLGQLTASHSQRPLLVSHRPFEQELHVLPPTPHCVPDCDANCTHSPVALQQPVAHVAGVQGTIASGATSSLTSAVTTSPPVCVSVGLSVGESLIVASPSPVPVSVPPSAPIGPSVPPSAVVPPSPEPVMSPTPRRLVHAVEPSAMAAPSSRVPQRLRPVIALPTLL